MIDDKEITGEFGILRSHRTTTGSRRLSLEAPRTETDSNAGGVGAVDAERAMDGRKTVYADIPASAVKGEGEGEGEVGTDGSSPAAGRPAHNPLAIDLIVATPGRLLDHMRAGNVFMSDVQYVVVDEADTMYQVRTGHTDGSSMALTCTGQMSPFPSVHMSTSLLYR